MAIVPHLPVLPLAKEEKLFCQEPGQDASIIRQLASKHMRIESLGTNPCDKREIELS